MNSRGIVVVVVVFFFNDTATTEIYTLSLHDALPICTVRADLFWGNGLRAEENAGRMRQPGSLYLLVPARPTSTSNNLNSTRSDT